MGNGPGWLKEFFVRKDECKGKRPDREEKVFHSAGPHNCGGRCRMQVRVQDGRVVGIDTDLSQDSPDALALKSCLRCRSYRERQYHPERLREPLRRVGRRGEGKFRPVTWEEATEYIASEWIRLKAEYGPECRYVNYATGHAGVLSGVAFVRRLLALDGGYLGYYNNYSNPCATWAMNYTYGTQQTGHSQEDWLSSRLLILWGFNPAETVFGTNTMYYLRKAKEGGARVIVIDPRYTDTAQALADRWISIRPTTDNALMDAMAYVMIKENRQDQDFLDRYTVGFDGMHMPQDIPPGEDYKSYVMGKGPDQIEKSPGWAETITGVPAEEIVRLAREYAGTKPAAILCGYGIQRHAYGEQPPRGAAVLAAMTGNVGRSGGSAGAMGFPGYGRAPQLASVGVANPVSTSIPAYLWTDALLKGTAMSRTDGVEGSDHLKTPVQMIFNLGGNTLINQHGNINRTRKILEDESLCQCIVVSEQFMTPSARFADIILPATTHLERVDLVTPWAWGDYVLFMDQAVEPLGQCRDEYDWLVAVSEKLGLKAAFTAGRSRRDWLEFVVEETRKTYPEFPDISVLQREGGYRWYYDRPCVAFAEQIADPEHHPFPTPSGKIEIFSRRLWDMGNSAEIPAVPRYIPACEGPEDELRTRYPLQCIGPHTKRRVHSIFDNSPWLEETKGQEMTMNPADGEKRGIQSGDRVRVYNDRGELHIGVKLSGRILPGVVAIPQGAWWTPDGKGVDQRGCINVLTHHRPTPLAKANPQHTLLVEVEKI